MLLHSAGVDILTLGIHPGSSEVGPLVHVGEEQRGADRGPVMQAGAAVAMAAGANFEIERAIDTIFLCAEDGSQVFSHAW